jgi:amino acid permease
MLPIIAVPLETSLVAYMELIIVLAFFVGWYILEKVANSYDRDKTKPDEETRPSKSDGE